MATEYLVGHGLWLWNLLKVKTSSDAIQEICLCELIIDFCNFRFLHGIIINQYGVFMYCLEQGLYRSGKSWKIV